MNYYESPALKLKKSLLIKQRKLQDIANLSREIDLLNIDWSKKKALENPPFSPSRRSFTSKELVDKTSMRRIINKSAIDQPHDLRKRGMVMRNIIMKTDTLGTPNSRHIPKRESNSFQEAYSNYIQEEKKKSNRDFHIDRLDNKLIMEYNGIMMDGYLKKHLSEDRPRVIRCFTAPLISHKLLENLKEEVVNTKPITRRHNSFEEELMSYHRYEEFPLLSTSCIIDKVSPVRSKHLLRNVNSFEYKNKHHMEDSMK
jgi:hypothetical protein